MSKFKSDPQTLGTAGSGVAQLMQLVFRILSSRVHIITLLLFVKDTTIHCSESSEKRENQERMFKRC